MDYKIFTDGSCINLKYCGYGVVITSGGKKFLEDHAPLPQYNTNNAAELYAIYRALLILKHNTYTSAVIYSDSEYAINSITKWSGSSTKSGKPRKNMELIDSCKSLLQDCENVKLIHCYGHGKETGSIAEWNDLADQLARNDAISLKS